MNSIEIDLARGAYVQLLQDWESGMTLSKVNAPFTLGSGIRNGALATISPIAGVTPQG